MKTGIHIGNVVDKAACENVAKAVERVLEVGFKTHASQATIRAALAILPGAFAVTDATVSGCQIKDISIDKDGPS